MSLWYGMQGQRSAVPVGRSTAIFTTIVYLLYGISAIVIINKTPSKLSVGILIGAASMMAVMMLQIAIFWVRNVLF